MDKKIGIICECGKVDEVEEKNFMVSNLVCLNCGCALGMIGHKYADGKVKHVYTNCEIDWGLRKENDES